ncbi:TIR domain-containing protein [Rhodococcus sp. NBC_00294]|uniref:TIR domain-containing protein n=1 Tax=Rhodococcus sp. NBC_00294 TaxID=2976004 RepID=UPI002E27FA73|nr:TIR domain-containing protein [Rhodococcus sp. NBC_00294]
MADDDLKVFISWSGDLSREVTRVIRHWLPKMFDRIDPWMSDIDIQAGTRGLTLIEERLNESQFGIIVITVDNMEKTWLNFEAGALSKKFGESVLSRVVPIMVDLDSVYQITGPIRQFQAVKLDQNGMRSLLESIAQVTGNDWDSIKTRFEWSWQEFEEALDKAREIAGAQPEAPKLGTDDLLKQVLNAVQQIGAPQAPTPRRFKDPSQSARQRQEDEDIRAVATAMNLGVRQIVRAFGGEIFISVVSDTVVSSKHADAFRRELQKFLTGDLQIAFKEADDVDGGRDSAAPRD